MLQILHEEADFLVVHKPPGLASQGDAQAPGVLSVLRNTFGYSEVYPVHRLDKVTSGLMVVARNSEACSNLSQLFQQRQVSKTYIAISPKKPKKKMGVISGDMSKSRNGAWKLLRSESNPAVTQFFSHGLGVPDGFELSHRLFVLKPLTGKTHQIRASMKSLGAPILGDELYSGMNADRVYLHAWGLSFPYDNELRAFVAPPAVGGAFLSINLVEKLTELSSPFAMTWPVLPLKHRRFFE